MISEKSRSHSNPTVRLSYFFNFHQLGFSQATRPEGPLNKLVKNYESDNDVAGPPDEEPKPEHQRYLFIWVVVQPTKLVK